MNPTPFRRALGQLLGDGSETQAPTPPIRDGYSPARRAVAGLLGVRLPDLPRPTAVVSDSAEVRADEARADEARIAIMAVDAPVRLAARQGSLILAVVLSDLIVRSADVAIRTYPIPGELLHSEAHAIGRDIIRVQQLDHAGILGRPLPRALDNALAFGGTPYLDIAHNRTLDLALSLTRALRKTLNHIPDQILNRYVVRSMTLAFASDVALGRALIRARQANRILVDTMCRSLGIQHNDFLPAALLNGALEDFQETDLSHVDLTAVDLAGMRWSRSGTRWPPETDMQSLLRRSAETAPGSGTYVIDLRDGTSDEIVGDQRTPYDHTSLDDSPVGRPSH